MQTVAAGHTEAVKLDASAARIELDCADLPARRLLEQREGAFRRGLSLRGGVELDAHPPQRPENLRREQQRRQARRQADVTEHQTQSHAHRHQRDAEGGDQLEHQSRQKSDPERRDRRGPVGGTDFADPARRTRRAGATGPARRIGEISAAHRTTTISTLRMVILLALVLELIATLGVACVLLGFRLVALVTSAWRRA